MIRRVVSVLALVILAVCLSVTCFSQAAPPAATAEPGVSATAITPGSPSSVPSPCVVNALRILSPQRIQMLAERLKLTDDQKTRIAGILNKSEDMQKPLIQTQKVAAEEFVVGLTKAGLHEAELQAVADAAMKAESVILTQRIKTLVALRAALNPDQVTELNTMIDQTTVIWRSGGSAPGFNTMPPPPTTPPAPPK